MLLQVKSQLVSALELSLGPGEGDAGLWLDFAALDMVCWGGGEEGRGTCASRLWTGKSSVR